jgi:hypothetical protein
MLRRLLIPLLAVLALVCSTPASAHDSTAVVEWNRIALQTTAQAPFNPPRETRSMAIVQAAVLDSVTSITRARPPYLVRVRAPRDASVDAAVAAAAHAALVALYPKQRQALDAQYAGAPAGDGAAVGEAVAAAVLALRAHDGADVVSLPPVVSGPGAWVPTPPAFRPALEPGWGRVMPFLLRSGSALRPPPPPAVGSRRYARDLREIAAIGSIDSTVRTPDQTQAAQFWVATAPQLWNQVLQQRSAAMSATRAAYAFALLNLAGADAFIASWDAKLAYMQWRPITGVRAAGDDGWTPLLVTPPFPDYPAAHSTYAGAAETVLAELLGDRSGHLALTSAIVPGAVRTYRDVSAIADEVVGARVWGGVHWRTSSEIGRGLGDRLGRIALRRLGG